MISLHTTYCTTSIRGWSRSLPTGTHVSRVYVVPPSSHVPHTGRSYLELVLSALFYQFAILVHMICDFCKHAVSEWPHEKYSLQ